MKVSVYGPVLLNLLNDGLCKVLQGSLKETLYDWPPDPGMETGSQTFPLRAKKETVFHENEVTYMSDKVSFRRS